MNRSIFQQHPPAGTRGHGDRTADVGARELELGLQGAGARPYQIANRALATSALSDQRTVVFLISPTRLFRELLRSELSHQEEILVAGDASTVAEAVALIARTEPQLVLLDLPAQLGPSAVRSLRAIAPAAHLVAIAVDQAINDIAAWANAGVRACVAREAHLQELLEAIDAARRGDPFCSPSLSGALFQTLSQLGAEMGTNFRSRIREVLTPREVEVLHLLEQGYATKQIASTLCLAVPTVKNHIRSILGKLDVHSRADAVEVFRASAR